MKQRERGEEKGGKESKATSGKDEYFIKLVKTQREIDEVGRVRAKNRDRTREGLLNLEPVVPAVHKFNLSLVIVSVHS